MPHNAVQKSCKKKLKNREINNAIYQQVTAIIMGHYSKGSTQRK